MTENRHIESAKALINRAESEIRYSEMASGTFNNVLACLATAVAHLVVYVVEENDEED